MALREEGIVPETVAGFSLGEIPALAFAGAYSPEDGFRLACARGAAMGKAAKEHPASMVAVMKMENEQVEALAEKYSNVFPVNYNGPGQLVVAGKKMNSTFRKRCKGSWRQMSVRSRRRRFPFSFYG